MKIGSRPGVVHNLEHRPIKTYSSVEEAVDQGPCVIMTQLGWTEDKHAADRE